MVVLVGQARAVAIAVKNVSGRRRWSKLDTWPRARSRVSCCRASTIILIRFTKLRGITWETHLPAWNAPKIGS
jgi:hypothetical protein